MKGTTVLLLAASSVSSVLGACTNPIIRMEWSQLSEAQKTACEFCASFKLFKQSPSTNMNGSPPKNKSNDLMSHVNAIVVLTKRPLSGQLQDPSRVSFYDFVASHTNNAYWAHGNAQFYPYHRAMTWQFDLALQTVGWTNGLVYWDWPAMSQNWWTSDIFSSKYFGAVRSNDPDNCVLDGAFAKDKYQVSKNPPTNPITGPRKFSGNPTCLRRCGEIGSAVTDATAITQPLLSATTYSEFRGDDTSNYHAVGHETIGGSNCDMGNPSFSPNDPLFYFHHGLVDKTWWRWQQSCPGSNIKNYEGLLAPGNGPNRSGDPIGDGVDNTAYGTLSIDSFTWWTVNDVLNTQGDVLCFTYSKSGGDLPIPPQRGCKQTPVQPSPSPSPNDGKPTTISGNKPATASTTAAATTSTGPSSANHTDPVASDTWMAQLLVSLVQTKSFSFNVVGKGKGLRRDLLFINGTTSAQEDSEPITPTEETNPTTQSTTAYTLSNNANGSKLVTLPDGTEITIAQGYTINRVYQTNVQAINNTTGKPRMFHATVDAIPYVKLACAPSNVTAGVHPCFLAYPRRVSLTYAGKMQMDLTVTSNNDNIVAMAIDQFNCECEKNYSPSQMRNQ
ncbi:UNVERIFIED_CONTAM: hypothetical protein HDU68_006605 [Siphonaria sp. JEL0065]|nr:hypothetical protein HDU68_006605 [Siphonaria sp. JEL0065]